MALGYIRDLNVFVTGVDYFGEGIFMSQDGGTSWNIIYPTHNLNSYDTGFDLVNQLVVNPVNQVLYAAISGAIMSYNPSTEECTTELGDPNALESKVHTDVTVSSTGKVYASFCW